ncbi:MAG: efflux RND transporter periplasmic adaptor subunit [Deltaproteobacteria bacterium]|nr:efflux RND transporter periplasmic adaptor subunit [Deltaproteobacteria bacterium]
MRVKKLPFGRRAGLLLLLAAGLLAAAGFQFRDAPPPDDDVRRVQAVRRSFNIVVRSLGVLDAGQAHMVASTLKGSKGKIIYLIDDGAWVKKGDVLVKLDPAPFEEEIRELQGKSKRLAAALEAKKQLLEWEKNRVVKELSSAEFKIRKAELELLKYRKGEGPLQLLQYQDELKKISKKRNRYQRYLNDLRRLQQQGYDNQGEMARAEQELREVEEKYAAAKRQVESYQNYVYPSMLKKLEADIEQAKVELAQIRKGSVHRVAQAKSSVDEVEALLENCRRDLEESRKKLKQTVIRAPSDGIVILYEAYRSGRKRKPRIGDLVLQNQPILYLPDISTMIVKTRVREIDLHKVEVGKSCDVTVDAYPDRKFTGRIAFIGALAAGSGADARGGKYFQMTVVLDRPDSRLRPGMTARVSILAARVENVLTLPVYAIFEDRDGRYCYRCRAGGCEKVRIKTGRENEDFAEVLAGIRPGDWVRAVPPPAVEEL